MLDLDMSPYAAFVWPAWGISAVVLAALSARALIAARRWKRELATSGALPDAAEVRRVRRWVMVQAHLMLLLPLLGSLLAKGVWTR